ncbi:uncharacterized protein LOC130261090 [Oenanthe melanoleuca]|uniref:uncharacterized protein LOC130261090 n=1 Tax=Oenanthe melanoleuca TaxID=2939378 RepID=UPI0024C1EFDC|nr:uncharacterized protein LOC130261090 [Oenanthe melanoleuca]
MKKPKEEWTKQEGAVGSEAHGNACGCAVGLVPPVIGPGRSERARDTRVTGATPPRRQGAQRAVRPGTNQARCWGGVRVCGVSHSSAAPSLGTSSPGFQRHRARGAGVGWQWERAWEGCVVPDPLGVPRGPLLPSRGRGATANGRSRRVGGRAMPEIILGKETEAASREKRAQPPQFGRAAMSSRAPGEAAGGGQQGQTHTDNGGNGRDERRRDGTELLSWGAQARSVFCFRGARLRFCSSGPFAAGTAPCPARLRCRGWDARKGEERPRSSGSLRRKAGVSLLACLGKTGVATPGARRRGAAGAR